MISCTEFIPAYSELFKFLEAQGGKEAVVKFWESQAAECLTNLRDLAATKGLAGIFEHYSHTLTEEAADFRMTLDEKKGILEIEMRHCPSRGLLNETKHIEPYEHYCEHCEVHSRRLLEPLGFKYNIDLSTCKDATCKEIIEKKPST
jgi:predicted ArsR family transcriptional regulator